MKNISTDNGGFNKDSCSQNEPNSLKLNIFLMDFKNTLSTMYEFYIQLL